MRSWRPFCRGLPGAMRSGITPALISFTDSLDRPPAPREAKGEPLSERRWCGKPNSREGGVEHRPDMIGVRAPQVLAAQQIAAMGIAERQRFAPPAVMAYCSRT